MWTPPEQIYSGAVSIVISKRRQHSVTVACPKNAAGQPRDSMGLASFRGADSQLRHFHFRS